jgi:hypothetical protein
VVLVGVHKGNLDIEPDDGQQCKQEGFFAGYEGNESGWDYEKTFYCIGKTPSVEGESWTTSKQIALYISSNALHSAHCFFLKLDKDKVCVF